MTGVGNCISTTVVVVTDRSWTDIWLCSCAGMIMRYLSGTAYKFYVQKVAYDSEEFPSSILSRTL